MKSYTDLEQSKKLAEILPIESADMMYQEYETVVGDDYGYKYRIQPFFSSNIDDIPCWSLAALLGVLPSGIVMNKDSQNGKYHSYSKYVGTYVTADNPIDACVAVIEKLNELGML